MFTDFWSATAYDESARQMPCTDLSSRKVAIQKNDGALVDVYFGPKGPARRDSNSVQTEPGKRWFAYFRVYGPTEPFFDKSGALPNVKKVD